MTHKAFNIAQPFILNLTKRVLPASLRWDCLSQQFIFGALKAKEKKKR